MKKFLFLIFFLLVSSYCYSAPAGSFVINGLNGNASSVPTSSMFYNWTNGEIIFFATTSNNKLSVSGTINATTFVGNGSALTSISAATSSTANYSATSNYSLNSGTSNFATIAGTATSALTSTTANFSSTANFSNTSISSLTSVTANFSSTSDYSVISSFSGIASLATTSNYSITANYSFLASTANYSTSSGTSLISSTANFATSAISALTSITSNYSSTSNYSTEALFSLTSTTANYSLTSNYANTSNTSNYLSTYPGNVVTDNYFSPLVVNDTLTADFLVGDANGVTNITNTSLTPGDFSSITGVGDINSGTWNAGPINVADGNNESAWSAYNSSATVSSNSFTAFSVSNSGTANNIIGYNMSPNLNGENLIGLNINSGAISNSVTGINAYGDYDMTYYTLINANPNVSANNISGMVFNPSVNVGSFSGINIQPSGEYGSFTGLSVTPTGNSTLGFTGLNINPSGSHENLTGIYVDVNNATSSTRKTAIQLNGGSINSFSEFTTTSNFPSVVDVANGVISVFKIVSGDPIVNTDFMGFSPVGLFQFEDNYTAGGLNIGYSPLGFVGQVSGVPGKTASKVSMAAAGFGIPASSTGGTLQSAYMYNTIGILPFGGTLTVDNVYGFHAEPSFGALATNSWGVSIEDSSAENYLAKSLLIGSNGTQKVANSDIALEVGTKKAILPGKLTTSEKNALIPTEGMTVYDTDAQTISFYDGVAWSDLGTTNLPSFVVTDNYQSNVSVNGTISANIFIGDGSEITNLTAGNIVGTVATANYAIAASSALTSTTANYSNTANFATTSLTSTTANFANESTSALSALTSITSNYSSTANFAQTIADNSVVDIKVATAAAINATKIANGSVSNSSFQYLSNVTSDIQSQLNSKVEKSLYDLNTILIANTDDTPIALTIGSSTFVGRTSTGTISALSVNQAKIELGAGVSNGLATLDGGGKVPSSQLPNSVMEFLGNWNASSNIPVLSDGVGNSGDVYRVSVAGTQNLGSGTLTFNLGDWITYSGLIWEQSNNSDSVTTVFSRTGDIVAANGDYTASQVTNVPAGNIASITAQSAINELDSEKQPSDNTLTGLSSVTTATDEVIYSTGIDTFSSTGFTAFGRSLVDDINASAGRTTLGIDSASNVSFANVSVSGTVTASSFVGNGSGITNVIALTASTANFATTSQLANTVAAGVITNANLVTGNFGGITGVGTLGSLTLTGPVSGVTTLGVTTVNATAVSATTLSGNGSAITNLTAGNIVGTVSAANLPSNVVTNNYTAVTLNNLIVSSTIGSMGVSANAILKNVTANRVDAGLFNTIGIDYAEWFDSEGDLVAGDVVGMNIQSGKVRRCENGDIVIGVVSTSPGLIGGVYGINKALVALMGQVPVNESQVLIRGRRVFANGKLLGILLESGNILLRINP